MANLKMFQIYDNVAMTVVGMIMLSTRAEAIIRTFTEELSKGQESQIGKYPEDYSLLELGEQDQDTGEITPYADPKIVYTGRVWLRLQQRDKPANPDSSSPANTNGAGEQPSGFITGNRHNPDDYDDMGPRRVRIPAQPVSG